jgi:hypothetical protein
MKNKFTSYGVEYNFGSDKNGHIKCLDWFLPRFKSEEWEPETFELFNYVKDSERAAVDQRPYGYQIILNMLFLLSLMLLHLMHCKRI